MHDSGVAQEPTSGSAMARLLDVDLTTLRRRPGWKWSSIGGRVAAWVADMDYPIAPSIAERLVEVATADVGYPRWGLGTSPAADAFCARMADRYGWTPNRDGLVELNDVIQGVEIVVHHLSEPGDGVVLHTPAYPPFRASLLGNDRRIVGVPAVRTSDSKGAASGAAHDDGWAYDYDELERRLSDESARLWVLCHPQNPTGHVFDRAELERIAEVARRFDLTVISDEVHADLVYEPRRHVPFATVADHLGVPTITVSSASKAFNLAGLRWAIMHVAHDGLLAALADLPRHYLGTANLMGVEAAVTAWTSDDAAAWLDAVRHQLDRNRHQLAELLSAHLPGVDYMPPHATYLAWLDCRRLGLGDEPVTTFRDRGVELGNGNDFGDEGRGFVRLNFATSGDVLSHVVAKMASAERSTR